MAIGSRGPTVDLGPPRGGAQRRHGSGAGTVTAYKQRGDIPPPKGRGEIPPQGRGEFPPPRKNVDEIEVSNLAVFKAAVGLLAERAGLGLTGWTERTVEALRRRLFSGRLRPADDYDEPRSEIS